MKRLPNHTLTGLNERTGLPKQMLSDYLSGRRTPGYSRAKELSDAVLRELGVQIEPVLWLEGDAPRIVRSAIFNIHRSEEGVAA